MRKGTGVTGCGPIHLPAIGSAAFGTILPVVLRTLRTEGPRMLYGLEFRSLLAHQTRKLNVLLEAVGQNEGSLSGA